MEYIHLVITPISSKIYITFELIDYSNVPEYFNMKCNFRDHSSRFLKLFSNGSETRCFNCIPWGNMKSNSYKRIGKFKHEFVTKS
jgi:hypothetical protein